MELVMAGPKPEGHGTRVQRLKIASIVGARPQFVKAAVVSRELRLVADEVLIHTGQHYDAGLSQVFFDELSIPRPDHRLGVGSGPQGGQTGLMLERIEKVLSDERPDFVLVYGDTNSTLAGALDAAKLHLPLGHVEAGLRSRNRRMPEEINRIVADHCADLLLCPTLTAVENLRNEGVVNGVRLTGDVMFDAVLRYAETAAQQSTILSTLGLEPRAYALATVHRAENTDDGVRLGGIVDALISCGRTVVFPVHPRTSKMLALLGLDAALSRCSSVRLLDPVGYFDMIRLEQNASVILTDSGGVQKEAYFFGVPCITLRAETEWIETVRDGWNVLAGADAPAILDALENVRIPEKRGESFGDGRAAEAVVRAIREYFDI
jgi:UDP-N-acetylglucosamine 2-epimerase